MCLIHSRFLKRIPLQRAGYFSSFPNECIHTYRPKTTSHTLPNNPLSEAEQLVLSGHPHEFLIDSRSNPVKIVFILVPRQRQQMGAINISGSDTGSDTDILCLYGWPLNSLEFFVIFVISIAIQNSEGYGQAKPVCFLVKLCGIFFRLSCFDNLKTKRELRSVTFYMGADTGITRPYLY
jgi:hypothetical protein